MVQDHLALLQRSPAPSIVLLGAREVSARQLLRVLALLRCRVFGFPLRCLCSRFLRLLLLCLRLCLCLAPGLLCCLALGLLCCLALGLLLCLALGLLLCLALSLLFFGLLLRRTLRLCRRLFLRTLRLCRRLFLRTLHLLLRLEFLPSLSLELLAHFGFNLGPGLCLPLR